MLERVAVGLSHAQTCGSPFKKLWVASSCLTIGKITVR